MNCPHCQQILPDNYSAAYCPFCGDDFPGDFPIEQTPVRAQESKPRKKWKWWLAFHLVFFGSPVVALGTFFGGDDSGDFFIFLAVGWIVCSWLLIEIFRGKLLLQILSPMLVLATYLGFIFMCFLAFLIGIGMTC
jgi:hypothetical protein